MHIGVSTPGKCDRFRTIEPSYEGTARTTAHTAHRHGPAVSSDGPRSPEWAEGPGSTSCGNPISRCVTGRAVMLVAESGPRGPMRLA